MGKKTSVEDLLKADGKLKELRKRRNLIPVSYTHLDVYKRQDYHGKLRRCFRANLGIGFPGCI